MSSKMPALDETLRKAKLRPTRQRMALAELLFSKGDRHVSAETLFDEAQEAGVAVSLATIYNTLHQFTDNAEYKHKDLIDKWNREYEDSINN